MPWGGAHQSYNYINKKHLKNSQNHEMKTFKCWTRRYLCGQKSKRRVHIVTCTKWQRWCKSHWNLVRLHQLLGAKIIFLLCHLRHTPHRGCLSQIVATGFALCTVITGCWSKRNNIYCYKFVALFHDRVSLCGLNFLMEPNENKRHSASPWENSEVMPKEPGNHNGVSRHKRLAYPSEYSRWCPSHLCCASYILASAHTDEGGCCAAASESKVVSLCQ